MSMDSTSGLMILRINKEQFQSFKHLTVFIIYKHNITFCCYMVSYEKYMNLFKDNLQ